MVASTQKSQPAADVQPAAYGEKPGHDLFIGSPNYDNNDASGWTQSWTAEEEKRLVRKVDFIVMPILMLVFFGLQLDRANIGNALTDSFLKDVGISQNQFNVGQQLLNAGIVVLEIPSNLVLYRVGPRAWISTQIFAWGLVATFQAFQKSLGSFLATRLLLGLLESGFIPGSLFTITQWYRGHELSRRYAFFFLGNGLATAAGGLIAYGILHMRGVAGLTGWQWLFILEGIFTILTGVVFVTMFPGMPSNPISLAGIRYFNDREVMILRQRKALDGPSATTTQSSITLKDVLHTLSDVKVWLHVSLTTAGLAPSTALWSYAPTMVSSFGYSRLSSNALSSVGQWISVCLVIILGFIADRWGRRGWLVLIAVFIELAFTVAYKCLPDDAHRGTKYAMLTLAGATCSWWHAAHGSWLAINAPSPTQRSIRMAMFIMAANCAGIIGSQLFRADDKPNYHRGWSVAVALLAYSAAVVIVLLVLYVIANARIQQSPEYVESRNSSSGGGDSPTKDGELGVAPHVPAVKLYNF